MLFNHTSKGGTQGDGSAVSLPEDTRGRFCCVPPLCSSPDTQDRLVSEKIGGIEKVKYIYDKRSNVAQVNDYYSGVTTDFSYDLIGRIIGITSTDGQKVNYSYDNFNRLKMLKWSLNNVSLTGEYIYGDTAVSGQKAGLIYGVKTNGIEELKYTYDELCRLKTRTLETTTPYVTQYSYLEGAGIHTTTTLVKTVKNGNDTLEYAYDELGNITSVKKNNVVIESYTYDSLNQLTGATYGGNTYVYTYDNGGNILSVTKNGTVIKTYTYGNANWKDLLTQYNGYTITYDTIGNPLQYRDGYNFSWSNGRQLSTVTNGANSYSYTYNADSLRTSKTVNGVTTNYYWSNGILQAQKTGDEYLIFLYDENGSAYGFLLKNGTTQQKYYYIFNAQGDVIGIVDSTGTKVVEYTYGAWGDILSVTGTLASTIGQLNPIRYRGYYYDAETGFYYVSSRYYDPEIGRWINADNQIAGVGGEVLGYNMFAYCMNNPVNMSDPTGNWPSWSNLLKGSAWLAVGITAVCVGVSVLTCGVAAPAMVAVAAVTVGAGALTAVNGAAEIGEAFTGYNVVRDTVFSGNQKAYDAYANTTAAVAEVGTAVCGGWLKSKTPTSTSRCSTGRTEPANLREQLAMEQVKSNPSAGTQLTRITLNDPRWPSSEGWVKMQQIVPTSQGDINIHYVYNQTLKIFDDFKFKP